MHAFIAEAQRYSLICKRIKNAVHSFYHNHKMKPGTLLKELSCLNETECCAHGVNEAILLGCIWLSSECLKYVGVCCSRYCPSLQPDYTTNGCAGVHAVAIDDSGQIIGDFLFETPEKVGRVLSVRTAPLPACTASLAIATAIVDQAINNLDWKNKKPFKVEEKMAV